MSLFVTLCRFMSRYVAFVEGRSCKNSGKNECYDEEDGIGIDESES